MMIRRIREEDQPYYLSMARDFYSSEAVDHNIPEVYFHNAFYELMRSDAYMVGYIMEHENRIAGYSLLTKTFSQEAGGMVLWIDELYVKPEYRSFGLGHEFFAYLKRNLGDRVKRIRLEAENSNQRAVSLYREMGFRDLPYCQLIRDL